MPLWAAACASDPSNAKQQRQHCRAVLSTGQATGRAAAGGSGEGQVPGHTRRSPWHQLPSEGDTRVQAATLFLVMAHSHPTSSCKASAIPAITEPVLSFPCN